MDAAGVSPRTRHTLDREERGPQASTRILNRELDSGPNIEDTETQRKRREDKKTRSKKKTGIKRIQGD
jgi:hypothetical protein